MPTLAVIWRAAGLLFATGVESIVEVLPPLKCRPAPGAPPWVRGLFCHRDQLIPLVDVTRLLGKAPADVRMANRVLVVRRALGAGSADWPVGLWVESVLELERIDFEGAGNHPGFETDAGRFLGPIAQTRWGQVQRVDAGDIFTPEEAAALSERLSESAA